MTKYITPPSLSDQLSRTKTRLHVVERRLAKPTPIVPGYKSKWSITGKLIAQASPHDRHPTGGTLVLISAVLAKAGSTTTTLVYKRNNVAIATMKILPNETMNQIVMNTRFMQGDLINVELTEIGTGAETLTAFADFDR